MSNEELNIVLKSVFQLAIVSGLLIAVFIAVLRMAKATLLFITKKRIALKLKKYELSKYTIYFDINGLPTTLVEKETNQIKFI